MKSTTARQGGNICLADDQAISRSENMIEEASEHSGNIEEGALYATDTELDVECDSNAI
ncbi:MAG: hypothetical protein ISR65_19435 [Bacteriovoracaceae bacterium]|nr:hypothetical protein [Bacteriovoracaceae bacterium]